MKTRHVTFFFILIACQPDLAAQEQPGRDKPRFGAAAAAIQQRLEAAIKELGQLREKVAAEKIPLSRKLNGLEAGLIKVRSEYQEKSRLLDSRALDLNTDECGLREAAIRQKASTLGPYSGPISLG